MSKLILDANDESELFHAFQNRGNSDTKRKVAKFLRELDSQKGRTTPDNYWYASAKPRALSDNYSEPSCDACLGQ